MSKRVVVTGMGAITPIGNNVEAYWQSLQMGKCGIDFITHFDTEDFKVKIAAEVKDFDPTQYIPKAEVKRTDMFAIFAMAAAMEAMADSGLEGNCDPERLGVYIGAGIGGMETYLNNCNKLLNGGPKKVSPFMIPMMIANVGAGNVAIRFGAKGPCLPVVTACATGTHSIGEAFHAIKHGYADAIIAGGAESTINPLAVAGFTNCMALTERNVPAEACVPFDKRRDGFVIGEGAGVVILEELEHARNRGAKIYGEMLGYGNSCDAFHITAPEPEGEGATASIRTALAEAAIENFDPSKLYINAHGTSTPLNDKTETVAIKNALGQEAAKQCMISSTKSMTGHLLGAAGAVEVIAGLLAMEHSIVPPTIGYQEPDEECDLDYVPNQARKAQVDYVLSNSLGFGGHNGTVVLGKYK